MATVLFLDTNSAGNGTRAMRHAQAWGYRAHFLARQPDEYANMHHDPLAVADEVTVVDTLDAVKLMRLDYGDDVVATIAFDELRVVQAALLAKHLGVSTGPTVAGAVNVRFKDRTRRLLAGTSVGVRYVVCPLSDAPATSPIQYPCVVKPIDEAASTGVRVCRDDAEFMSAVDALRDLQSRPNNRGYALISNFIVEEYIDGDEYSAELVWSTRENDWRLIGFTKKTITPPPWCLEIGELFPHHFEESLGEHILSELRACLQVLGLHGTVVHLEFRLRDGQPYVIDVNPRSAGDRIPDLVENALGVDLTALHLAAHLGTADDLLDQAEHRCYAGVHYVVPPHKGVVTGFDINVMDDPGLVDIRTVPTPFEVGEPTSNSVETAQIVVRADTPAKVLNQLKLHSARIEHHYLGTASGPRE